MERRPAVLGSSLLVIRLWRLSGAFVSHHEEDEGEHKPKRIWKSRGRNSKV